MHTLDFMLYRCLNAKRIAMHPYSPLPVHVETSLPMCLGLRSPTSLQLRPVDDDGIVLMTPEFFQPEEEAGMTEAGHLPPGEDVESRSPEEGRGELAICKDGTQETGRLLFPSSSKETLELIKVGRRGRHIMLAKTGNLNLNVSPEPISPNVVVKQGRSPPVLEQASIHLRICDLGGRTRLAPAPGTVDAAKFDAVLLHEERADILFQQLRAHRNNLARERKWTRGGHLRQHRVSAFQP